MVVVSIAVLYTDNYFHRVVNTIQLKSHYEISKTVVIVFVFFIYLFRNEYRVSDQFWN